MINAAIRGLFATFALAVLAGCEAGPQQQRSGEVSASMVDQRITPGDSSARTIVWGQAADWQLGDQQRLIAALNEYGVPQSRGESLRAWIARIKTQSPVLGGLGGPPAMQFLELAEEMTLPAPQGGGYWPVPSDRRVEYTTTGQLVPAEYFYNASDGSGRLQVIMTTMRNVPQRKAFPAEAYKWTIRIRPGGFVEHPKDLTEAHAGNVFPETPLAIPAQQAAGFNYKLFAQGPNAIEIESIEVKHGNGQWTTLQPSSHPFYNVDAMSCIDIMFPGEPPATLDANAVPPLYCLGRCSSPPIVNTK